MLGTRLTLLIGPSVPTPASAALMLGLRSVKVVHNDSARSGFELVFGVGRNQTTGLLYFELVQNPMLVPFARLVLILTVGAVPQVLMDGIVTQVQLSPSNEPGASTLTLQGEDVSIALDRQERSVEHPAQPEIAIVAVIVSSYSQYGLVPVIVPPASLDVPLPTDRTPTQQGTDLAYLQEMAARFGYVFYVTPGPAPLANVAYWGPPVRAGVPQPALTYNMGPASNVKTLSFQNNALSPTRVEGQVQDRTTGQTMPVQTVAPARIPLSAMPAATVHAANIPTTILRSSGLSATQTLARAQGITDAASDLTVQATGELDAGRYGGILQARGLVGLRGAGYSYDGLWYVKSVTHNIAKGSYSQSFELAREGTGSTVAVVRT